MPISSLTSPSDPGDLPADAVPSLQRIARSERVGPTVANRQIRSLEKRTVTLISKVNELVTSVNAGASVGGALMADGTVALTGNLDAASHKVVNLLSGTAAGDAVNKGQLDAVSSSIPAVPIITAWVDAGATSIGAVTTAPTKGTVVTESTFWRRVGDTMEVRWNFVQAAATGSSGSGDYLFTLPAGKSIDLAKCAVYAGAAGNVEAMGYTLGSAGATNGGSVGDGLVVPYDATRYRLILAEYGSSSFNFASSSFYGMAGSRRYSASFSVPISGWGVTTGAT